MTFVKDRELFKAIFFPDKEHLTSNQEVLAHHWFGIEKELSMDYTEQGLINTRKALKQSKARRLNDTVARGIEAQLLRDFGGSGEAELMDFAWLTFWPVNEAMFGAETVSPAACPLIREQLETYNSSFEQVANGVPRAAFPEMEAAAVAMSSQFASAIDQGFAERDGCPVLQARVSAIKREDSRWSSLHKGRFVMSVFWAAQANTVPGTFWALALCLADPAVAARCRAEARGAFAQQPDAKGEYDIKVLPYLQAVVKETLRLKVANITHRKAQKEFVLRGSDAKQLFRVRRGDTLTVCSHLNHFDPAVFPEPGAFRPERWLDGREKEMPPNSFFPFGGGPNTCSGKFLAMQEMAVLLGIFFRDYDAELIDPLPQEEWENVVAMVTPKKGQHCRVRYTRINKS
jgi:cytochrome P450